MRKQCETCRYYLAGDPIGKIGNMGTCIFMLRQETGFYDHPTHVPFWARELINRVTSWEGKTCPTWEKIDDRKE